MMDQFWKAQVDVKHKCNNRARCASLGPVRFCRFDFMPKSVESHLGRAVLSVKNLLFHA